MKAEAGGDALPAEHLQVLEVSTSVSHLVLPPHPLIPNRPFQIPLGDSVASWKGLVATPHSGGGVGGR